ncbi:MAG: DJ-1/PfpI family protein [Candidatus Omnitrophica bacterium]|nr:DJ-1/PfpI family protein [Candidatus Omnitrophota bacterium]
MAKKVLVILADGFEEIEAVTPIDVLRRAGVEVILAGLSGKVVTGAHGIKFQTDVTLDEYKDLPDAMVLPGGMPGAQNLGKSPKVAELVKKMNSQNKIVGAICAAPALAVAPTGILNGRKATCYPGFEKDFPSQVTFSTDRVVVDGNVITSRGPGSAFEFALELVEKLVGKEKVETLREGMLVK